MIAIPRILCPIDFSDVSQHALDHAIAIARWYGSTVTALHVVTENVLLQPPILFAPLDAVNGFEQHEIAETRLATWLEPARRCGVPTRAVVEHGDPARAIVRHAGPEEFDLVIVGTHGRGGFEHFMLGSVAEKVLRKSRCPVLTVPPRIASGAKIPYARLLCPVDFSASSLEALRFAFSIAEEADARLTILNVLDYPSEDWLLFGRAEALEFRRYAEEDARQRLDSLIGGDERVWCKPEGRIEVGKAYERILAVSAETHADLIVMGVRGRNPMDIALFGSTTNNVVRAAVCPVLTIRK